MDGQAPLVMALDDPGAAPGVVGGKGASLARLARAGFHVPPGFHVTTSAYLDFIGRGTLHQPVLAAMSAVDVSDAATFDAASARIGELFTGQPLPAPTAAAIAGAYASLGDDTPVAVRSSATVEDLPGMSAAGQHDTYLNVRGEAAVLAAVKRCWASLWSARAIGYRARRGIEPGEVGIAVVVQQLVLAEAAGVMFTVDPLDGAHDRVVISANWGLGESDVAVVDRTSGTLVRYQVGSNRLPRLRANRRALLRQREHVDPARSPGRHLAAPVRRALRPGPRQATSGQGDPSSAASPLEGHPADGARHGSDATQSQRKPEAAAGVRRRRAEPLRPAPRRHRADHRRREPAAIVARQSPAPNRRGLRHAVRRCGARHRAGDYSGQAHRTLDADRS